jgi:arylsulfatase A-like enzyme
LISWEVKVTQMIRIAGTGVLAALLLSAAGCGGGEPPLDTRPNVLLIAVDTLRADKLGCYGSELGATPRLDALAADSVVFEQAYAHSPWTLPSFASLFTSLYPPQHGAGGYLQHFTKLGEEQLTLAELYRDAGYETAAVVNVDFLTRSFGTTQGFEHVDFEVYPDNVRVRPADRTTDAALAWLRGPRTRPFLLLVHYFDPHTIYAPPAGYRERFAAPADREPGGWTFGTRAQIVAERNGRVTFDEATIRRAERLYNGEVAHTDHEVGRLLDGLREAGLAEDTIVLFTADHGEEFWDHGGFEHGHTMYEELLHVPLLISWPGSLAPGAVPATVGHVDVAPTLCDLSGVVPDPGFAGRSLAPYFANPAEPGRPMLHVGNFWGPPMVAWRQGTHKLIVYPDQRVELYDVTSDPEERSDLAGSDPRRVDSMREDLDLAWRSMEEPVLDDTLRLTPEQEERLRSLGYLD